MKYNNKLKLDFEEKEMFRNKMLIEIGIWAGCILGTVLFAYLLVNLSFEKTTMSDISMETTLKKETKIVINKLSYSIFAPDRFDVIVFELEGNEHNFYNVKRVIGLPGEKVQIKEGKVYIDDKEIKEKVNVETITNPGLAEDVIELEDDEFFVLGDNRNNSEDSRFANVGIVKRDEIIGKAWIKEKPIEFINRLNEVSDESDKKDEKED